MLNRLAPTKFHMYAWLTAITVSIGLVSWISLKVRSGDEVTCHERMISLHGISSYGLAESIPSLIPLQNSAPPAFPNCDVASGRLRYPLDESAIDQWLERPAVANAMASWSGCFESIAGRKYVDVFEFYSTLYSLRNDEVLEVVSGRKQEVAAVAAVGLKEEILFASDQTCRIKSGLSELGSTLQLRID
jgi:hypothetical protein